MPHNSTTPRKLRVIVELDVTEGPRLRRGTTKQDMLEQLGLPIRQHVAHLAHGNFGLDPESASVQVMWAYEWMNVTATDPFHNGQPIEEADQPDA